MSRSAHIDGGKWVPYPSICALLPQTPSLMFRSVFDINFCFAVSKARGTLSFQNHAVLRLEITVPIHIFIVVFSAVWPEMTWPCRSGIYQVVAKICELMIFQNHLMGYPDGMPSGPPT